MANKSKKKRENRSLTVDFDTEDKYFDLMNYFLIALWVAGFPR